MASANEDGDSETATFTAAVHVQFIKKIFEICGSNARKWIFCQISDNEHEKSILNLLQISHVGCNSHKLNIDVRRMINQSQTYSLLSIMLIPL